MKIHFRSYMYDYIFLVTRHFQWYHDMTFELMLLTKLPEFKQGDIFLQIDNRVVIF